jgi:hypothetical protein
MWDRSPEAAQPEISVEMNRKSLLLPCPRRIKRTWPKKGLDLTGDGSSLGAKLQGNPAVGFSFLTVCYSSQDQEEELGTRRGEQVVCECCRRGGGRSWCSSPRGEWRISTRGGRARRLTSPLTKENRFSSLSSHCTRFSDAGCCCRRLFPFARGLSQSLLSTTYPINYIDPV